jgi:VWFA-related protein
MRFRKFSAAWLLALTVGGAQQPSLSPSDSSTTVIRSASHEVVLEASVRDKRGKVYKKLLAADVAIFEDGVRQDVRSFRLVAGNEVRAADQLANKQKASGSIPGSPNRVFGPSPLRTVNLVCLVFGNLMIRTEAGALAAAQKFAESELRPNTFIAILSMASGSVRQISNFTNNRDALLAKLKALQRDPCRWQRFIDNRIP